MTKNSPPCPFQNLFRVLSVLIWIPATLSAGALAYIEEETYRAELFGTVELWNGGLTGDSGMGAYQSDFDGLFHVHLNNRFEPVTSSIPYWQNNSVIGQTRANYMNAEAALHEIDPEQAEVYRNLVRKGTDYLLQYGIDDTYDGFFWRLDYDGSYTPDGNSDSTRKDTYGNTFVIFAFANAYAATGENRYLEAALDQIQVLYHRFEDPDYPRGFLPSANRSFSSRSGNRHFDPPVHLLEALMILYDHTDGADRKQIANWIEREGDFICEHMVADVHGQPEWLLLPEEFTTEWAPHPTSIDVRAGHTLETAFLLSRAVERGLGNPGWVDTAQKIMNFSIDVFVDPVDFAIYNHGSDYNGNLLSSKRNESEWWHICELVRALGHFAVVRGRMDYWPMVEKAAAFILDVQTDPNFDGLLTSLAVTGPSGDRSFSSTDEIKSHIWKVNYHDTMYRVELLRLLSDYGDEPTRWAAAHKWASGRRELAGFGEFQSYGNNWIHHSMLGPLFTKGDDGRTLWIHHPGLGWLFTGTGVFPFLQAVEGEWAGDWLYLFAGGKFWNASRQSYFRVDPRL